ncbi:hypothetical protein HK098_004716, partial [Nowakowskiella sp. JEL0407]
MSSLKVCTGVLHRRAQGLNGGTLLNESFFENASSRNCRDCQKKERDRKLIQREKKKIQSNVEADISDNDENDMVAEKKEFGSEEDARIYVNSLLDSEPLPFLLRYTRPGNSINTNDSDDSRLWTLKSRAQLRHNSVFKKERYQCICYRAPVSTPETATSSNNSQEVLLSLHEQDLARKRSIPRRGIYAKSPHTHNCKRAIILVVYQTSTTQEKRASVRVLNEHTPACRTIDDVSLPSAVRSWISDCLQAGIDNKRILNLFYKKTTLLTENRFCPPTKPSGWSDNLWTITEKQVENVAAHLRRKSFLHEEDHISTLLWLERNCPVGDCEVMTASQLSETMNVLYFQSPVCACKNISLFKKKGCFRTDNCRAFIAVIQDETMRNAMKSTDLNVVCLDATGTTNMYRWPLYALVRY